jgi:hypothetical protein
MNRPNNCRSSDNVPAVEQQLRSPPAVMNCHCIRELTDQAPSVYISPNHITLQLPHWPDLPRWAWSNPHPTNIGSSKRCSELHAIQVGYPCSARADLLPNTAPGAVLVRGGAGPPPPNRRQDDYLRLRSWKELFRGRLVRRGSVPIMLGI